MKSKTQAAVENMQKQKRCRRSRTCSTFSVFMVYKTHFPLIAGLSVEELIKTLLKQ